MPLEIRAGPWSFSLPSGWKPANEDPAVPYFESGDGTWGCYVKALQFSASEPLQAPRDLASHVQSVHAESFAGRQGAAWQVQAQAASSTATSAESTVDHLDTGHAYRVVSQVRVAPPLGLHLTLHHYVCESYPESVAYANNILLSVRHDAA